ncbi:unnamed protein product [Bursaphelenchus okinawaensis]|uniref:Uncharacterized protein n=1 Tax=Bursaphelenchus okinawaensis TaxID=465554 RepID=A0A811JV17_9BILA|nr:unnamed protein product [Bursaphelenchus okinawaensis]CAG9084263.1 unnamed protein product [Bursaphelenchus okinawaensis]
MALLFFFLVLVPIGTVDGCLRTTVPAGFTIPPDLTTLPPTTLPPGNQDTCEVPEGTLGVTFDSDVNIDADASLGFTEQPVAKCTSCSTGTRYFFEPTTQDSMDNAAANSQEAAYIQCDDWSTACMCNSQNDCCSIDGSASSIDSVNIAVWCDSTGACQQYLSVGGDATVTITCPSGTTYTTDGSFPFSTSSAYFQVNAFSCSSCDGISSDPCQGPTVPVT